MNNLESQLISENCRWWRTGDANSNALREIRQMVDRLKSIKIIGPCAAQSTDQLSAIIGVIGNHADIVRAPLKKPRTRPVNSHGERLFDGVGIQEGKVMLINVAQDHPRVRWAMETMDGDDISLMQETITLPWIGSRNQDSQNCRDIGQAAAIARLPVMIKNPLTGNVEDWLGMIENVIIGSQNQIPVMACIRGRQTFSPQEQKLWRNTPNLDLISLIKKSLPELPVIIDPSHMVHKQDPNPLTTIEHLLSQALDLGANGIMIEASHPQHISLTDPGVNAHELINLLERKNW